MSLLSQIVLNKCDKLFMHFNNIYNHKRILMGYFRLRCFQDQMSKYVLIALNGIVAILGVIHLGFAGLYGKMSNIYQDMPQLRVLGQMFKKIYAGPIAYFVITGLFQIAISVLIILVILQKFGNENRLSWARLIMLLLLFQFGFNFYIAVGCSMNATFYNENYKDYLSATQQFVDKLGSPQLKAMYRLIATFCQFCVAQAILTWIIALPAICVILLSVADEFVNEKTIVLLSGKDTATVQVQDNNSFQATNSKP